MSLIDEAAQISGKPRVGRTAILRIVEALDGDARDEVIELVWGRRDISARAVAEVLTKHYAEHAGRTVTQQMVQEHRDKPELHP